VKETKRVVFRERWLASELFIVPKTSGNWPNRDPAEGKGSWSRELLEGTMPGIPSPTSVSPKLQRIAELARQASPRMTFTSLAHHIDVEFLREAYRRTRKDGAVGVDGVTAEAYAVALESNLQSLLTRFRSGTYFAPPVRRVHIPKGDGTQTRPIGIPTFEDKVLQKAVKMVLEAVYEQDFLPCSYGFRPGRSQHDALSSLRGAIMDMRAGWLIDLDVEKFFDSVDHGHLRAILDQRVRDGVLRKAIDKWLKAGVMEEGVERHPEDGTPQGGVISPLLANIYLHEVLDLWFETAVKPRLRGDAHLVRFADDAVIACQFEDDARRVMDVLPKRFGKFGLRIHPTKSRLVDFRRPPRGGSPPRDERPDTFDFLGFTHFWAKSMKGNWVVKQKTMTQRFSRAMKAIALWCRLHRHRPVAEQHRMLSSMVRGHYNYYGVLTNRTALRSFKHFAEQVWMKWLRRRSQRAGNVAHRRLLGRYPLPSPPLVLRGSTS
jgi:RNA-directed DNA polymerase